MNRRIFKPRRGVVLFMFLVMIPLLVLLIAFAIDIGFVTVVRTQLQNAADSAALAGAGVLPDEGASGAVTTSIDFGNQHKAGPGYLALNSSNVEVGGWDGDARVFNPGEGANGQPAVRVRISYPAPLTFAKFFGVSQTNLSVESIASMQARDIAFVVDLSGSMNDDTEPAWATDAINQKFGPLGYPNVGDGLIADVYADFGWGAYPGAQQFIGEPLGVTGIDGRVYAAMTADGGPLSDSAIVGPDFLIVTTDDEATRKRKCYSWIMENQVKPMMPNAKPECDWTKPDSYEYWERYIDYVIYSHYVSATPLPSGGSGGGGPPPAGFWFNKELDAKLKTLAFGRNGVQTKRSPWEQLALGFSVTGGVAWSLPQLDLTKVSPPIERGWIPPKIDWNDHVTTFNNPNYAGFASPPPDVPWKYAHVIGYRTYLNFMMDFGRDKLVAGKFQTPLQIGHPNCPKVNEGTAGGIFEFPAREMPMHACRRSLIAAVQQIKVDNATIPAAQRDRITIVSFDRSATGGQIRQALTADYNLAMLACTKLQAVSDVGSSTTTDSGLQTAWDHIKPTSEGGAGRIGSMKVSILLTDGMPNDAVTPVATTAAYIAAQADQSNYYLNGTSHKDGPIMIGGKMKSSRAKLFPVGIGLGTDYDFMDRLARESDTAISGQSVRGSGNPAEYETRLIEIFDKINKSTRARLVQ